MGGAAPDTPSRSPAASLLRLHPPRLALQHAVAGQRTPARVRAQQRSGCQSLLRAWWEPIAGPRDHTTHAPAPPPHLTWALPGFEAPAAPCPLRSDIVGLPARRAVSKGARQGGWVGGGVRGIESGRGRWRGCSLHSRACSLASVREAVSHQLSINPVRRAELWAPGFGAHPQPGQPHRHQMAIPLALLLVAQAVATQATGGIW